MFESCQSHARPIRLPLELHYPKRTGMWFAVGFGIVVTVHILVWATITVASIVSGQFRVFLLLFPPVQLAFSGVAVLLFRGAAAKGRIGAGSLKLDQFGLWDTRLSNRPIAWTAFAGASLLSGRRSGIVSVRLRVGREEALPPMNEDYRKAYQPFTNLRRYISVELVCFPRRRELARLIIDLVEEHQAFGSASNESPA